MAPSWLDKLADNQQGITTQVADVTGHRFNYNYNRNCLVTYPSNTTMHVASYKTEILIPLQTKSCPETINLTKCRKSNINACTSQYLYLGIRVENGSGHPGHILPQSTKSDLLYKISRSDLDFA